MTHAIALSLALAATPARAALAPRPARSGAPAAGIARVSALAARVRPLSGAASSAPRFTPAPAQAPAAPPAAEAAAELERVIARTISRRQPVKGTGVAVAVVKDGEVILAKGYGYRDRRARAPVDERTLFGIGSTSKGFASLSLHMLAADGTITLSRPVREMLPEFGLRDPAAADADLVDLLGHRTGVPRHDALWYLTPLPREELAARIRHLEPARGAAGYRGSFQYNNLMYTAAGRVLERAAGQPWEGFVRARILEPLGMDAASFTIEELAAAPNHAKPYLKRRELPMKDVSNIAPAGAINAHALDLAKWVSLHLSGGQTPGGAALLPPEAMARMYEPLTSRYERGRLVRYGQGWARETMAGRDVIRHLGHTDGYAASISFLPEEGLGVVVLVNQHGHLLPELVTRRAYETLLGRRESFRESWDAFWREKPAAWRASLRMLAFGSLLRLRAAAAAIRRPSAVELESLAGAYADPGYGEMRVESDGRGLTLRYFGNRWPLRSLGDGWWLASIEGYGRTRRVPLRLTAPAPGRTGELAITLEPTVSPIRFVRR